MEKHEPLTMSEIIEQVQPVGFNDLSTLIIAKTEPKALADSIDQTFATSLRIDHMLDPARVESAEKLLEDSFNAPQSSDIRKESRKRVEKRLLDRRFASIVFNATQEDLYVANLVEEQKINLSKPIRYISSIACSAILGLGVLVPATNMRHAMHEQTQKDIKEYNKTAKPEFKMKTDWDNSNTSGDIVLGFLTLSGIGMGALYGRVLESRFPGTSDRFANKRAQRIIKKTDQ